MTTDALRSALVALHQARVAAASNNELVRILRESWDRGHAGLLADQQKAKADLEQAETYARNLALATYQETGNKRPVPGVEIKDFVHVTFDGVAALAWAIKHELALKLDTDALKRIAKAQGCIPGVAEVETEPVAMIATDLSKFVTEEAAP